MCVARAQRSAPETAPGASGRRLCEGDAVGCRGRGAGALCPNGADGPGGGHTSVEASRRTSTPHAARQGDRPTDAVRFLTRRRRRGSNGSAEPSMDGQRSQHIRAIGANAGSGGGARQVRMFECTGPTVDLAGCKTMHGGHLAPCPASVGMGSKAGESRGGGLATHQQPVGPQRPVRQRGPELRAAPAAALWRGAAVPTLCWRALTSAAAAAQKGRRSPRTPECPGCTRSRGRRRRPRCSRGRRRSHRRRRP